MVFRRPMVVLQTTIKLGTEAREERIETRSSSSSASPLNLFTNPFNVPKAPDRPNVTRGLNFDDNAFSKNTMRGYAIGIPMYRFSLTRSDCYRRGGITELYNEMLHPCWQWIQSVEDLEVLFVITHSSKLSFCSDDHGIKKSYSIISSCNWPTCSPTWESKQSGRKESEMNVMGMARMALGCPRRATWKRGFDYLCHRRQLCSAVNDMIETITVFTYRWWSIGIGGRRSIP